MAASFLKKNLKLLTRFLLFIFLLLPLWMWLAWMLTPKRKLVVAIIDKTVLTKKGQEHISLNWVLNHQKFSKNATDLYSRSDDYFGFFPLEDEKYRIKGLERFSNSQLQKLSEDVDLAYITDAYGIYKNEWYKINDEKERSGILYGGLSSEDMYFLKQVQLKHKLIITEFNCIGSPTNLSIRHDFENSFGVKWSGWIGRYFGSFDTTVNLELPKWLVKNYKRQHNNKWPFTKSGIAFVKNDETVEVLEDEIELNNELPYMYSGTEGQQYYGLPSKIKYSFWFDIVSADTSYNHVISVFKIDANEKGKRIMRRNGIPAAFPAITAHINKDYRFFYFSADFCDNPVGLANSYFKGIKNFSWMVYNTYDQQERTSFFWQVYRPMVTTILEDYYKAK